MVAYTKPQHRKKEEKGLEEREIRSYLLQFFQDSLQFLYALL